MLRRAGLDFKRLTLYQLDRSSVASCIIRSLHVSNTRLNNTSNDDKPQLRESDKERDRFLEMMNDRTFALLRSLRMDVEKLKSESQNSPSEGAAKIDSNSMPILDTVDPSKNPKNFKPHYPPQLHFFDTQDVYSELRSAGLTPGQSEVIMRTMQELIDDLVVTCTERAVPVGAAANEAYLFDSASSEVRNEISNSRQVHATSYRSGLARLQRDVEILDHEATEMTNSLNSDLDIDVHERKNADRVEESTIQLKIQELHNKISTRLNSELKSEIENLRWQITRRSLAAIAIIAATFIWLTQTNSSKKTTKSVERERQTSGKSVHVPVLAPSVQPNEDAFSQSTMHVEGLSNYGGQPQQDPSEPGNENATSNDSNAKNKAP